MLSVDVLMMEMPSVEEWKKFRKSYLFGEREGEEWNSAFSMSQLPYLSSPDRAIA